MHSIVYEFNFSQFLQKKVQIKPSAHRSNSTIQEHHGWPRGRLHITLPPAPDISWPLHIKHESNAAWNIFSYPAFNVLDESEFWILETFESRNHSSSLSELGVPFIFNCAKGFLCSNARQRIFSAFNSHALQDNNFHFPHDENHSSLPLTSSPLTRGTYSLNILETASNWSINKTELNSERFTGCKYSIFLQVCGMTQNWIQTMISAACFWREIARSTSVRGKKFLLFSVLTGRHSV